MPRQFMQETNRLKAPLKADTDKFYDTNAPGIRINDTNRG